MPDTADAISYSSDTLEGDRRSLLLLSVTLVGLEPALSAFKACVFSLGLHAFYGTLAFSKNPEF